jgi:hypothetical protein
MCGTKGAEVQRPDESLKAKLRRVRLVLMDIDGTLVTSSKATFDNVSNQLRRLKTLNVHFSIATGRTVAGARQVLEQLRASVGMRMLPAINYNGAVLLSPTDGALVERHLLDPQDVTAAVFACRKHGLWPLVYACYDKVSGPPVETVYVDAAGPSVPEFNGMKTTRVADVAAVHDDIVAILADAGDAAASASISEQLETQLGGALRVTTSGSRYVEICSRRATKHSAMERLAQLYHVELDQVLAIGDNLNDVPGRRCRRCGRERA